MDLKYNSGFNCLSSVSFSLSHPVGVWKLRGAGVSTLRSKLIIDDPLLVPPSLKKQLVNLLEVSFS